MRVVSAVIAVSRVGVVRRRPCAVSRDMVVGECKVHSTAVSRVVGGGCLDGVSYVRGPDGVSYVRGPAEWVTGVGGLMPGPP
jgi:hypothetical protein